MDSVYQQILDSSPRNLLLTGISGTGKSLAIKQLALLLSQQNTPFIYLDYTYSSTLPNLPNNFLHLNFSSSNPSLRLDLENFPQASNYLTNLLVEITKKKLDPKNEGLVSPKYVSNISLITSCLCSINQFSVYAVFSIMYNLKHDLKEVQTLSSKLTDEKLKTKLEELITTYKNSSFGSHVDEQSYLEDKMFNLVNFADIMKFVTQSLGQNLSQALSTGNSIYVSFQLDKMSEESAKLFSTLILANILLSLRSHTHSPYTILIDSIDKATSSPLYELLSEAKPLKLTVISTTQCLPLLDSITQNAILGNVGTYLIFKSDRLSAEFFAKKYSLPNLTNQLSGLSINQAFLASDINHQSPVLLHLNH